MNIENFYIMGEEPLQGWTVDDVREWLKSHSDQQSIIDAFAAVHNKHIWVEDDEYDYEIGTTAYAYACEQTDAWSALADELLELIFGYVRDEGGTIPETGWYYAITPFMEKHGYRAGNGWWVPKK